MERIIINTNEKQENNTNILSKDLLFFGEENVNKLENIRIDTEENKLTALIISKNSIIYHFNILEACSDEGITVQNIIRMMNVVPWKARLPFYVSLSSFIFRESSNNQIKIEKIPLDIDMMEMWNKDNITNLIVNEKCIIRIIDRENNHYNTITLDAII